MEAKTVQRESVFHPHFIANRLIRTQLERLGEYLQGAVLDLGCGEKPYQDIFCANASRYYSLDYARHEGASVPDLLADVHRLPVKSESFDALAATQVLEHVSEPEVVLRECSRVLRKKGFLILVVPQTWALHCAPWDYYRFTRFGISHLLEKTGFRIVHLEAHGGVGSVVGQTLNNFLYHAFGEKMGPPFTVKKIFHNLLHSLCPLFFVWNALMARLVDCFDLSRLEVLNHTVVAQKD